ncbi:MAG: beta-hydroxyacyl-ACP dehydratase [Myxococcales bacterium]|nr:beta-hydroxyacyl-ACP dehydratase [Myxococcales bacterium]MCB9545033.1 beta-hydroxyacyl-ACP dehydratase [Myxococcales bacterium]
MRWWFLDRIDELVPGEHARGRKGVASSEDYFADHFPGFPVVPGVVQIEALAQLSGKLIEVTLFEQQRRWVWPILSMVRKAKFRRFVRPGDWLVLETRVMELRDESALCRVVSTVDGQRCTEAELLFVFNPRELDNSESQATLERVERENLRILWAGYAAWAEANG